ncbi:hypothetical protein Tco_0079082 [Tanacetum coccineum]
MLKRWEDTEFRFSNWVKCAHLTVYKNGIVIRIKFKVGIEVDRAKVDVVAKLPQPDYVKVMLFRSRKKKLDELQRLVVSGLRNLTFVLSLRLAKNRFTGTKLDNHLAKTEKWTSSSKNLLRLIDSSMSVEQKWSTSTKDSTLYVSFQCSHIESEAWRLRFQCWGYTIQEPSIVQDLPSSLLPPVNAGRKKLLLQLLLVVCGDGWAMLLSLSKADEGYLVGYSASNRAYRAIIRSKVISLAAYTRCFFEPLKVSQEDDSQILTNKEATSVLRDLDLGLRKMTEERAEESKCQKSSSWYAYQFISGRIQGPAGDTRVFHGDVSVHMVGFSSCLWFKTREKLLVETAFPHVISGIIKRNNHTDFQHCVFAFVLSQDGKLRGHFFMDALRRKVYVNHLRIWDPKLIPRKKRPPLTDSLLKKHKRDIIISKVYVDDIIFGSTKKAGIYDGFTMYFDSFKAEIIVCVSACSRNQVTLLLESIFVLEAYSDSDYAGENKDRKSTTGGCQFLGRRVIHWANARSQTIVAYLFTDAAVCLLMLTAWSVKNPVFHQRTKHIEIRHHFIRDANEKKLIQVLKIHTDDNVADLLTKEFDGPRFNHLVVNIGMLNP